MTLAHVRDVKTGVERTVQPKAYQLIPKRYTLLGWVNENMEPVEGPEVKKKTVTVQKKSVEPAVSKPFVKMTPEELEAKKAELRVMNEKAIQKALDEQAEKELLQKPELQSLNDQNTAETIVKERKKPGPKPRIKNEN
jgi:hypothetical protein